MVPTKLQDVCLTPFYYTAFKCPVDIILLPDACEAYSNTFYLPARNSKEIDSRKIGSRFTNFTLEYKDIYDFALIKSLKIPGLTTNVLTKLVMEIPKMKDITKHSLNTKLRKINKIYPWSMLTITLRSGNCMLLGKHLSKRRKSKSININQHSHDKGIAMKELNCSPDPAVLRLLSSTSTTTSLKSVAQRELLQLPNTLRISQILPYSNTTEPKIEKSISNL